MVCLLWQGGGGGRNALVDVACGWVDCSAEAAALREISVVLVVLFGMRYLKEPFGRPRLIACGLVLVGMLLMKVKP